MRYGKSIVAILTIVLVVGMFLACNTPAASNNDDKDDRPSNHDVKKDGAFHKSGLNDPEANCVKCHGNDLKGGSADISCYKCHSKKW